MNSYTPRALVKRIIATVAALCFVVGPVLPTLAADAPTLLLPENHPPDPAFVAVTGDISAVESSPSPPLADPPKAREARHLADGSFVENLGQLDAPDIRFYQPAGPAVAGFGPSGVVVNLAPGQPALPPKDDRLPEIPAPVPAAQSATGAVVRIGFPGSHTVEPLGIDQLAYPSHFFIGNDPAKWRSFVTSYQGVVYPRLYDGIDLEFSSSPAGVKYEFHLAPGASPDAVALAYDGVEDVRVLPSGDLLIRTAAGDLTDPAPRSFDATGTPVQCHFEQRGPRTVGFHCEDWDAALPLTIDPLLYGTYVGSSSSDYLYAMDVDAAGAAYFTGLTYGSGFPNTTGAYDRTYAGGFYDAIVTKVSSDGTSLAYSTYLGGTSYEVGEGIAVDGNGTAVVTGYVNSTDFPTTVGAYDRTQNGVDDLFVTRLSADGGALVYSTFVGGDGDDTPWDLVLDPSGNAFAAGYTYSTNYPTAGNPYATTLNGGFWRDVAVSKLDPSGSTLLYSTYFGGNDDDTAYSLDVNASGDVYLAGASYSLDLPTTAGAFNRTHSGGARDTFAAVFEANGNLRYSTFLGGESSNVAYGIGADATGAAWVAGWTASKNFTTTADALDRTLNQAQAAYLLKLDPSGGSLLYSTLLEGSNSSSAAIGNTLAVSSSGRALIVGYTDAIDMPVVPGSFQLDNPTFLYGAFLFEFASDASLLYGSYLAGSTWDVPTAAAYGADGTAFVGMWTYSLDLPTLPGAYQTTTAGGVDAYIAHLNLTLEPVLVTINSTPPGLDVVVNGTLRTAPYSFLCGPLSNFTLSAPSPQGNSTAQFLFANWSDGGAPSHTASCGRTTKFVANFAAQYRVTVESSPPGQNITVNGTSQAAPLSFWWPGGAPLTLFVPDPDLSGDTALYFLSWSMGGPNPLSLVLTGPVDVVANLEVRYRIVLDSVPPDLELRIDTLLGRAPFTLWRSNDGVPHPISAISPQGGTERRWVFSNWSDGGALGHAISITGPTTYIATFHEESHVSITTDPPGLYLTVDGTSVTGPQAYWWTTNSTHLIMAESTPSAGYIRYGFSNWSDGGAAAHSVVAQPMSLTANFTTDFKVSLDTVPANLSLLVDNASMPAPTFFWWPSGSTHHLEAPAQQGAGAYAFAIQRWADGGPLARNLTVNSSANLTALFETLNRTRILTNLDGGNVNVDGVPMAAPAVLYWSTGSAHEVSVPLVLGVAGVRYTFSNWSDGGTRTHQVFTGPPGDLTAFYSTEYQVNFTVLPTGAFILVDGERVVNQRSFWWGANTTHTISVPDPQPIPGTPGVAFRNWSDGAQQNRSYKATGPADLTVSFGAIAPPPAPPQQTGSELWILLALVAAAGAAAALLVMRRRRSDDEMTREFAGTAAAAIAPVAQGPPPSTPPAPQTFPCPQCGSPVAPGVPSCAACGLPLSW